LTIESDFNFANLNGDCGFTGDILVTYTITDECDNFITRTATLTIIDETAPVVTCDADDLTIECDGLVSNESQADAWNAANIAKLDACATDACTPVEEVIVTSNYAFTNLSDECGFTGSMEVIYTVSDPCGNDTTITATFTIIDTTNPEISCQPDDQTFECDGLSNNQADADAWNTANIAKLEAFATDLCATPEDVVVTSDYDFTNLSDDCGFTGSLTVTYTITDACDNFITTTATYTIEDTTNPTVTCDPQPATHECSGLDGNRGAAELWNQTNINALIACSSDECGTVEVTSDFDYAYLSDDCGLTGELTVTYTVTDECDNTTVKTATFTVIDTDRKSVV